MRKILTLIILMLTTALYAEEIPDTLPRAVYSAYQLEVGTAHICDTYLSPLHYGGTRYGFGYERTQPMPFSPRKWDMRLEAGVQLAPTHNRARSASMWSLEFRPQWAMMRKYRLPYGLTAAIGPQAALNLGALALMRNGNNPVSARASITIGASGYLAWTSSVRGHRLMLRYQPSLPLTGLFFSPQYDELYYEIYLGNHSGLCHGAWPGNFFRLDNLVTADITFGRTILRLGYHNELASTKTSGITTRTISHSLVVGVCSEWISLRPGSKKVISAY